MYPWFNKNKEKKNHNKNYRNILTTNVDVKLYIIKSVWDLLLFVICVNRFLCNKSVIKGLCKF